MIILHLCLLCTLLTFAPLLLVHRLIPGADATTKLTTGGILTVFFILVVALGLHVKGIPITRATLAGAHLFLGIIATISFRLSLPAGQKRRIIPCTLHSSAMLVLAPLAFLVLLLLPYTHFTGIDTYKWQDLATSVRMEQSLPWIVHPLSLFGFTPRAYPPAHPVLLATVQIVGGLGVEAGFTVVSLFTALLGLSTATNLARRLFLPKIALASGFLYCFSPVFMRYTHWATGRGLFLAIFPAFLSALLSLPRKSIPISSQSGFGLLRRWAVTVFLALLLLLTHKVALVAVPLALFFAILAPLLPRRLPVVVRFIVTLLFLTVAAAIVSPFLLSGPPGIAAGLIRTGIIRFTWMLPIALMGLWLPAPPDAADNTPLQRHWNILFWASLPALTLAFEQQMYGALYALPFICIFATHGLNRILNHFSPRRRQLLLTAVASLTLFGAVATIAARSRIATTKELYSAAQFLEAHDPQGPFMIHAPGITRTRIQAYVSGCARFNVHSGSASRVAFSRPSPRCSTLRATVREQAAWLRNLFSLSDTETDWYGNAKMHYYFIINGEGNAPEGAALIYNQGHIEIYESTRNARQPD